MIKEIKFKLRKMVLLALAVFVAACAPGFTQTTLPAHTPFVTMLGDPVTKTIPETHTPTADLLFHPPPATPTMLPEPDETLMVNNEGPTPYLVDDQGRSLYVYLNDSPNSGTSVCVDDCAVDWPPLTVVISPASGEGIDPSLVGTIAREDGSIQATYNGWPLYYYLMDTIPGTKNAPKLESLWFLLSPFGEPIGM